MRTPTSSVRANWGNELTTISSQEKQWRLSLDIKIKNKVNGWQSIIHATTGGNIGPMGNIFLLNYCPMGNIFLLNHRPMN